MENEEQLKLNLDEPTTTKSPDAPYRLRIRMLEKEVAELKRKVDLLYKSLRR